MVRMSFPSCSQQCISTEGNLKRWLCWVAWTRLLFIYCRISDGVYRFMPLLLHDRQKMIGDAFTLNWWTVCLVMNLDVCVCVGNRRLDEWVPLGRFESLEKYGVDTYHSGLHSTVGLDLVHGGDRKITRNQKRKHDAINHVQMVCFNCWST